jgi:hypothetical protein
MLLDNGRMVPSLISIRESWYYHDDDHYQTQVQAYSPAQSAEIVTTVTTTTTTTTAVT